MPKGKGGKKVEDEKDFEKKNKGKSLLQDPESEEDPNPKKGKGKGSKGEKSDKGSKF